MKQPERLARGARHRVGSLPGDRRAQRLSLVRVVPPIAHVLAIYNGNLPALPVGVMDRIRPNLGSFRRLPARRMQEMQDPGWLSHRDVYSGRVPAVAAG